MVQSVTHGSVKGRPLYRPPTIVGAHRLGAVGQFEASRAPGNVGAHLSQVAEKMPPPDVITVGDYRRWQSAEKRRVRRRVAHGIVELVAPPVLIGEVAYFKVKHDIEAYSRIFDLRWDPAGHWKYQAERIKREERAEGDAAIANLPLPWAARASGKAIVENAVVAGELIEKAWDTVGDYASDATVAMIRAGRETGRGAARSILSAVALTGRGMVDWAEDQKPSFQ